MANASIGGRLADLINPIAVKEMRQAVKSKLISWILMLFLLVQLVVIVVVLIFSEEFDDFDAGPGVFMTILGVLLGTCLLFLPAITALRLASERSDSNIDLLFITTLSPRQIMAGKLVAATILTSLFFSACLPFMTLTYLFRGLDLPSMFILLGFDFLIVVLCIQGAILLSACPGGLIARGVRFLLGLGLLFFAFGMSIALSGEMLMGGVGSSLGSWNFWGPALTIVAFILLGIGLCHVFSIALVSPPSSNRMIGVRIFTLVLWLASAAIMFAWFKEVPRNTRDDLIYAWSSCSVIGAAVILFISICERRSWSPRILRTIPKNKFLRMPAFLLYTGAAGGVMFSVLVMLASILMVIFGTKLFTGRKPDQDIVVMLTFGSLYAIAYALTSLFITKTFFKRVTFYGLPIAIALLLLIAGTVFPVIAAFLFKKGMWYESSELWLICNPFVMFMEYSQCWPHAMTFSAVWSAVISMIMIPWFVKQYMDFKPIEKTKIELKDTTDEPELSKVSA